MWTLIAKLKRGWEEICGNVHIAGVFSTFYLLLHISKATRLMGKKGMLDIKGVVHFWATIWWFLFVGQNTRACSVRIENCTHLQNRKMVEVRAWKTVRSVTLEGVTKVTIKITLFWNVASFILADFFPSFYDLKILWTNHSAWNSCKQRLTIQFPPHRKRSIH